ncbi:bifunctional DNA primase/polymerase [Chelativorans sp.]|uniref:bifunctional DNA primase/polymerase n=1 Tax=Chelativorans sp. TaxID=2203393 RepID=UPI002811C46C|nr:bifunctional DNA primase/polymerase [Chelativorans sp.]
MTHLSSNLDTALRLARAGFAVFPCHSGGSKAKQPMPFIKWRDASTTAEPQILQWWKKWPEAAIGLDLAKSNLLVIDADRHGEHDGVSALGELMAKVGYEPHGVPLAATPNEGTHFFYRQPPGKRHGNSAGALPAGVDVRGHGGYVIAPGTVMQDGRLYEVFGDIAEAPELPTWLSELLEARRGGAEAGRNQPQSLVPQGSGGGAQTVENHPSTAEIEELLSYIPANCGYHDWVSVLMAIHAATGGEGLAIADAWSSKGGVKYPGSKEIEKKWRSFKRSGITGRTLAQIAREHGADLSAIALKHKVPQVDPLEAAAAARRLIENHDGTLADAETGEIVNTEISVSQRTAHPDIYPPGLVGDLAGWIVQTARKPQPELAIGAALAIVGTAAGRQFCGPTRSGTHLYILGLAPTGTGKDHPLQQIGRAMTAAKLGLHLGPSEFISMPAVVNFIMRKPLAVCAMDEFGGFMKRINSKRASGFEGAISKVLRTLWSSSFAPYATPEWAQKESQTVYSPAITLFGASTPEQFYSSMEGASLEDGTLNRFLLLNGRGRVAEQDPQRDPAVVPVDIVNDLQLIYYRSGDLSSAFRNDPNSDPAMAGQLREIPWCPDGAHDRYKAFSAEIDDLMRKEAERGAFYARTVEMALRIATIVAIGRLDDDQVRKSDLDFGIDLALRSAKMMADGAADYMAENENQANAQKVLRIIKARGGRVKHKDLLYALRHGVKARELRDLISMMCESGQLERCTIRSASGPDAAGYVLSQKL